jgi:hypothetical protein
MARGQIGTLIEHLQKCAGRSGNPAAAQKTSEKLAKRMQGIWDETGQQLLEVLTSEQMAEWREMTGKPFKAGSR